MQRPKVIPWTMVFALAAAGCSDAGEESAPQSGGAGGAPAGGSSGSGTTGGTGGTGGTGAAGSGAQGSGGSSGIGGGGAGTGASGGSAGTAGSAGSAGTAGDAGTAGSAGTGGSGGADPGGCNPAFASAGKCAPEVTFQNDEADGDGAMFDQVIPDPIATLKSVACRVCTILYRDPAEVTRNPSAIRLFIHDYDGVAQAGGGQIELSSRHVANYDQPDDALFEFMGVLLHETTHLYQMNRGSGALIEGMADFVRIRAGHHRMSRRNPGGAWTDAYTTSGFFFSWLAGPGGLQSDGRMPADPDIGWAINEQLRDQWSDQVFVERLQQPVDVLWDEYQQAIR
jgi:hypothetical protein